MRQGASRCGRAFRRAAVRVLPALLAWGAARGEWVPKAPEKIDSSLFIDTTVQLTVAEDGEGPDLADAKKLAIWMGRDGTGATNLFVYAKSYDWVARRGTAGAVVRGMPEGTPRRFVLRRPGKPEGCPPSGSWCRLTVKAYRNLFASDAHGVMPCFRIFLDGQPLATSSVVFAPAMRMMTDAFAQPSLKPLIAAGQIFPSLEALGKPGEQVVLNGVDFRGAGGCGDVTVTLDGGTFPLAVTSVDWTLPPLTDAERAVNPFAAILSPVLSACP